MPYELTIFSMGTVTTFERGYTQQTNAPTTFTVVSAARVAKNFNALFDFRLQAH